MPYPGEQREQPGERTDHSYQYTHTIHSNDSTAHDRMEVGIAARAGSGDGHHQIPVVVVGDGLVATQTGAGGRGARQHPQKRPRSAEERLPAALAESDGEESEDNATMASKRRREQQEQPPRTADRDGQVTIALDALLSRARSGHRRGWREMTNGSLSFVIDTILATLVP